MVRVQCPILGTLSHRSQGNCEEKVFKFGMGSRLPDPSGLEPIKNPKTGKHAAGSPSSHPETPISLS